MEIGGRKMKGLILCGGKGSRLQPITDYIPKPLIPIANEPLIFYTIELLLNLGVEQIGIVVNEENKNIFKTKFTNRFKIDFHYIIQKESKGIANALLEAEDFIGDEKFIMILGDNFFELDLKRIMDDFLISKSNCKLLLKTVEIPEKFGVAYVWEDKIINVEEKPKTAFSNLAITGIYGFDHNIFKACKNIGPSKSGEYEITDAIKWMIKNGYDISYEILDGYWKDIGNHQDLIEENIHRLTSINEYIKGHIENSSISGKVILDETAVIYNSIIRGPIKVGLNTTIKNSYIGPYTSIGNGVNIDNSNIEASIILDGCYISSVEMPIDYSIIGEGTVIAKENGLRKRNRLVTGKNSKIYLK
jgi:glucose-1-phosphate thymidylyltransferase